jgi:hypothetical protein
MSVICPFLEMNKKRYIMVKRRPMTSDIRKSTGNKISQTATNGKILDFSVLHTQMSSRVLNFSKCSTQESWWPAGSLGLAYLWREYLGLSIIRMKTQ